MLEMKKYIYQGKNLEKINFRLDLVLKLVIEPLLGNVHLNLGSPQVNCF